MGYADPAINYFGSEKWWVTLTPTFRLSDEAREADFVVRVLAPWHF
jgi:hypothetical protein